MRSHYLVALVIASTLAAPAMAPELRRAPIAVEDLTKTAVVCDASRSTSLLPFELSAVRLRPGSRNRWMYA